jgi:Domain of unknown function (DUF4326)
MPRVLNVRDLPGYADRQPVIPPDAVYIGRPNSRYGLAGSKWRNPFRGEGVVEMYRRWLCSQPQLIAALPELHGRNLVCWCAPNPCHGDVLLEAAE